MKKKPPVLYFRKRAKNGKTKDNNVIFFYDIVSLDPGLRRDVETFRFRMQA
jgi:hypothetical protein